MNFDKKSTATFGAYIKPRVSFSNSQKFRSLSETRVLYQRKYNTSPQTYHPNNLEQKCFAQNTLLYSSSKTYPRSVHHIAQNTLSSKQQHTMRT